MNFTDLFAAYYNLYRAEADTPGTTDDEYTVALRLANEAINRWEHYDNTYWKELFNTLQNADDGDSTIVTAQVDYEAPSDLREVGGAVKVIDSSNNVIQHYPIVEPNEVQFKGDGETYCYFTGDSINGFTLHLSQPPTSNLSGKSIDYVYYKQATKFAAADDVSECPDPYFLINRMLAQRFRASRNPYYQSAKNDAENALGQMKMSNDSGNWAEPPTIADNSGSRFGA